MIDRLLGFSEVTYMITAAGTYELTISLGTSVISGVPFAIQVVAGAFDASKATALTLNPKP